MGRKPEGKAEHLLKNLGKKLDQVIEDIKGVSEDPKYKDRIAELKRNGEKLKAEFEDFKSNHQEAFDEVEETFERAGSKIREAFDDTFNKGDKTKKEA